MQEVLTREAEEYQKDGKLRQALETREELLMLCQRSFGDPSIESDAQKLQMGQLIAQITAQGVKKETGAMTPSAGRSRKSSKTDSLDLNGSGSDKKDGSGPAKQNNKKKRFQSLTATLSIQALIAFGERLLGPGNTLESTQEDPNVIDCRGKLLLSLAAVLHANKRPRAALPMAQRALVQFKRAAVELGAPSGVTLDVVTALLTMSALQSASNHHQEGLRCASEALETVLALEEEYWLKDPMSLQDQDNKNNSKSQDRSASKNKHSPSNSTRAPRVDSEEQDLDIYDDDDEPDNDGADDEQEEPQAKVLPRSKTYFGELQAACHYNIGTEQEYLGLYELALESFQRGFQIAYDTHGATHDLSVKLKRSYAEVFATVHFQHFRGALKAKSTHKMFETNPEAAVRALNSTYKSSIAHRENRRKENFRQFVMMNRALPPDSTVAFSHSQTALGSRLGVRPSSSLSRQRDRSGVSEGAHHRSFGEASHHASTTMLDDDSFQLNSRPRSAARGRATPGKASALYRQQQATPQRKQHTEVGDRAASVYGRNLEHEYVQNLEYREYYGEDDYPSEM